MALQRTIMPYTFWVDNEAWQQRLKDAESVKRFVVQKT